MSDRLKDIRQVRFQAKHEDPLGNVPGANPPGSDRLPPGAIAPAPPSQDELMRAWLMARLPEGTRRQIELGSSAGVDPPPVDRRLMDQIRAARNAKDYGTGQSAYEDYGEGQSKAFRANIDPELVKRMRMIAALKAKAGRPPMSSSDPAFKSMLAKHAGMVR